MKIPLNTLNFNNNMNSWQGCGNREGCGGSGCHPFFSLACRIPILKQFLPIPPPIHPCMMPKSHAIKKSIISLQHHLSLHSTQDTKDSFLITWRAMLFMFFSLSHLYYRSQWWKLRLTLQLLTRYSISGESLTEVLLD